MHSVRKASTDGTRCPAFREFIKPEIESQVLASPWRVRHPLRALKGADWPTSRLRTAEG
jgi:hypothetical protein